jgi:SAM-dependent methyltransferase
MGRERPRLLLRQVPSSCRRALDVGCGAGAFAAKLAKVVDHVDALDRSPVMIDAARRASPGNVSCILGDVLHDPLPPEGYDAIFSICALHHMPLGDALHRLDAALRPVGVLAALGLPRPHLLRELPYEVTAVAGHQLFGAAFAVARSTGRRRWYETEPTHAIMPVALDPPLTTRQVGEQAAAALPGVQVRRLVFWRYYLLWQKPCNESKLVTT